MYIYQNNCSSLRYFSCKTPKIQFKTLLIKHDSHVCVFFFSSAVFLCLIVVHRAVTGSLLPSEAENTYCSVGANSEPVLHIKINIRK